MIKHEIVAVSAAATTDTIAAGVTAASGVAFTLITNATSDDMAHKIIITPSGSVTGNYTIAGKNADGAVKSETLATSTTNAVTSVELYASDIVITAPAGLGAETVNIGITAASESASFNPKLSGVTGFNIGFGCNVAAGSPTYTVQHSYDNGSTWYNHASVAAETTDQEGTYISPVQAVRLTFTAAGSVTLTGYQAEG